MELEEVPPKGKNPGEGMLDDDSNGKGAGEGEELPVWRLDV